MRRTAGGRRGIADPASRRSCDSPSSADHRPVHAAALLAWAAPALVAGLRHRLPSVHHAHRWARQHPQAVRRCASATDPYGLSGHDGLSRLVGPACCSAARAIPSAWPGDRLGRDASPEVRSPSAFAGLGRAAWSGRLIQAIPLRCCVPSRLLGLRPGRSLLRFFAGIPCRNRQPIPVNPIADAAAAGSHRSPLQ